MTLVFTLIVTSKYLYHLKVRTFSLILHRS